MRENNTKRKLERGEVVIGPNLQLDCPWLVEIVGLAGFDYVMIDGEHGMAWNNLPTLILAADSVGITPIVRVPSHDRGFLTYALETGAAGIMVPMVTTVDQAREIVRQVRYAPLGERGFSTATRAAEYGLVQARDLAARGNRETMLILQIESESAVEQAGAIAAVPGIDILFVGPADLAQSLGLPGQDRGKKVMEAMSEVVPRVAGEVVMGTSAFNRRDVSQRRAMGYRMFLTTSTHTVRRAFEDLERELRSGSTEE
jgi:4-hydroxy-2-oxoheptanedioate aldolase